MHTLPPEDSVLMNDPISSHKKVNPLIILSKILHVPPINSEEPELSSELLLVDCSSFKIFIPKGQTH